MQRPSAGPHDVNQRNIGISVPGQSIRVSRDHPRNHDGSTFSVLVTRSVNKPRPGSDEISRAFEEAWIGTSGYVRVDGTRQRHALAFQGHVITPGGATISEVFVVDLPDNVTIPGDGPLQGTAITRPAPPRGTQQRRLTYTANRKYPGLQGPRHWLRSSPDGIANRLPDARRCRHRPTLDHLTQRRRAAPAHAQPIQYRVSIHVEPRRPIDRLRRRQQHLHQRRAKRQLHSAHAAQRRFHRPTPRSMRLLARRHSHRLRTTSTARSHGLQSNLRRRTIRALVER